MRLAIVHDWFIRVGGAERVLLAMHKLWPNAPIFFMAADKVAIKKYLPDASIHISRLGRVPLATRFYGSLGWAMPSAVESLDLSDYDTVLSSSVIFSKGVIVRPSTRHICYCYSPTRMLWDRSAAYERRGMLSAFLRHGLRSWDFAAAQRPDQMVAISQAVASRIEKYYRRDSIVIPPPMPLKINSEPSRTEHPYFLFVGRLMPHKSLKVTIDAFNKTGHRLIIAGDGPLRRTLKRQARTNIEFIGSPDDKELSKLYANATAVILPNEEDFGLTAVEAMAHGCPVLALRAGGAMETVIEGTTGEFFDDAIPEAIADGIRRIRAMVTSYDPERIRAHAAQWSEERWSERMRTIIPGI